MLSINSIKKPGTVIISKIPITIIIFLFFLTLPAGFELHAADLTPSEILRKTDDHRGIQEQAFALKITINTSIAGKTREQVGLISYVDNESNPNNWNTLVRMLSPAPRKGQIILMEKNRMWFYKPGTRRPVRISPAQRLLGGAVAGDVTSFNFREYYDVKSMSDVQIGQVDAYLFQLTMKPDSSAPYAEVRLWVQKKTFFPIQAEFYANSGRKLKSCYYREFKKILGVDRVTELVIVDELRPDHITRVLITEMKTTSLPPSYYDPNNLTKLAF